MDSSERAALEGLIGTALRTEEHRYFRHPEEKVYNPRTGYETKSPFKELDHEFLTRLVVDLIINNTAAIESKWRKQIASEVLDWFDEQPTLRDAMTYSEQRELLRLIKGKKVEE